MRILRDVLTTCIIFGTCACTEMLGPGIDSGLKDGAIEIFDGGSPDAGAMVDSGVSDGGGVDGGPADAGHVLDAGSMSSSWKNFYNICWVDTTENSIKYAKQMGYEYIGINNYGTVVGIGSVPNKSGLGFYLIDPWYNKEFVFQGYNDMITNRTFTQAERDFYNDHMVWKSTDPFPSNLASGHFWSATTYHAMWDFQQQRVIDMVVEGILMAASRLEEKNIGFYFAGVMFDVPRLWGDFHVWNGGGNNFYNLQAWTGANSSLLHTGITHQYQTYDDGLAAFFKQLNSKMKRQFPNAKWILEPGKLYNTTWQHADGWLEELSARSDRAQLVPDFLSQEHAGTEFVDDARNFDAGVFISKDMVGSSQTLYDVSESANRTIAGRAGVNGSWYNWFGLFNNGIPTISSVTAVSARLKLIRVLPNWDNLTHVSLSDRSWINGVYQSGNSFASSDLMYSRHWKTGKLFAVFLTSNGVIRLRPNEAVASVQRTDGFFVEAGDGSADVTVTGSEIRLRDASKIDQGYILTLKSN